MAATEKGDYDYTKADYTGPLCIIMGAEDTGVLMKTLPLWWMGENSDAGTIESLNVSVAAGILIYEAVKQRNNDWYEEDFNSTFAAFLPGTRKHGTNPKWVEKAKRAVFSIVTYDKNDKMLNTGNGFFVIRRRIGFIRLYSF